MIAEWAYILIIIFCLGLIAYLSYKLGQSEAKNIQMEKNSDTRKRARKRKSNINKLSDSDVNSELRKLIK